MPEETQKHILLVDDDPQIQDMLSLRLKSAGFRVSQARNGQEGVSMAKELKPDLILLDVMMPVMDGAKALVELKDDPTTKDIRTFILTSLQDRVEDIKFAKEVGAVDFLNKDIDFKDLLERIKSTLQIK
ncbi:MAG: response regulator [Candidatus Liptonbacteria bacterium]